MFVSYEKEKLGHAIVFFVQNTRHCYALKLLKLLNFLDFEHYRQTGYSVTNLKHQAYPLGPAAKRLNDFIKKMGEGEEVPDLDEYIRVEKKLIGDYKAHGITAKKEFERKFFSRRELTIMARLADIFKDTKSQDMTDYSHGDNLPWKKAYVEGQLNDINYEYAFESDAIIKDMAGIDKGEYTHRRGLFKEIDAAMGMK